MGSFELRPDQEQRSTARRHVSRASGDLPGDGAAEQTWKWRTGLSRSCKRTNVRATCGKASIKPGSRSRCWSAQYRAGLSGIDFNRYATIQQTLITQQDLWAQSRGQIDLGLIEVYRGLGGGWQIKCDQVPDKRGVLSPPPGDADSNGNVGDLPAPADAATPTNPATSPVPPANPATSPVQSSPPIPPQTNPPQAIPTLPAPPKSTDISPADASGPPTGSSRKPCRRHCQRARAGFAASARTALSPYVAAGPSAAPAVLHFFARFCHSSRNSWA